MRGSRNHQAVLALALLGMMMQSTAGTIGLADAMTEFMDSTMNSSGLSAADMNPLISQLSTMNGAI